MNYAKERAYVGHISQLFDVRSYRLCGGRQEGVRAVDICTGSGLEVTVLPDRCMDLYQVKFQGKNLCFQTAAGITAPAYYDKEGNEWLRGFFAGFLTTCGLTTIGNGSHDEGEALGLHGRISNTPADDFCVSTVLRDGVPTAVLRGVMNESVLFGNCLSLTREITCAYGDNHIRLTDIVENIGPRTVPHMILYHHNMGYPLVSEKASLVIPTSSVKARNVYSAQNLSLWKQIDPPEQNAQERCYYHELEADDNGMTVVGIDNPTENLRMRLRFSTRELPYFIQWRMLGEREYVIGLEPGNAPIEGRAAAREEGTLPFLEPGEKRVYHLDIEAGNCL